MRTAVTPQEISRIGRVLVLLGGDSSEREVSLDSGNEVCRALVAADVEFERLDTDLQGLEQLEGGRCERVFNALHGGSGEDGRVRALLDGKGIPCTGSSVEASSLTMDKMATKATLREAGLPTPDWCDLASFSLDEIAETLGFPLVVKPNNQGSSKGVTIVENREELPRAVAEAQQYGEAFAERFIDGQEITAGMVEGDILPLIHIRPPKKFYDFSAKYRDPATEFLCPAPLPQAENDGCQRLVAQVFDLMNLTGFGRVDLRLGSDGSSSILEVNSIPGLTSHSLMPLAAKVAGIEFPQMILRILRATLEEQS